MSLTTIADSVLSAIGNTPLVRLRRVVPAAAADVLVKLEAANPTGSYKDRMALGMVEGAEARGTLRPGMRVVEFTGGSTGSSLGMVCAAKGYTFVVLSSDAFSREKLLTMEAFGADLRMVPSDGGKVTPALFERFRKEIAVLASEPDTFWTDQFHNEDAVTGYKNIGIELLEQTGGRIDAFCGAVGTGGMLRGVARALREGGSRARHRRARTGVVAGADRGAQRRAPRRGDRHRQRAAAHGRSALRRSAPGRRSRRAGDGQAPRARRKGCWSGRRAG
jgi:cysteine synthase A